MKYFLQQKIVAYMCCLLSISNYANSTTNLSSKDNKFQTMDIQNLCENNGTVKIIKGNKAFTSYKNCLKYLDVAERKQANGEDTETTIKMLKRAIASVIKREPNADLSTVCDRFTKIEKEAKTNIDNKDYFRNNLYLVGRLYKNSDAGIYPENLGLENPVWFIDAVKDFNREEVLKKAKTSNDKNAKEIIAILNDYSAFIDRQGIANYLMDVLDRENNASSDQLTKKAKTIKQVALNLKKIAGTNSSMDKLIAYTDKQLTKGESALAHIYSSKIHKEFINQIVFTKQPFQAGKESNLEINPIFKTGDAVYATLYLSATIADAVSSWQGYGKGGTMGLKVKNSNGDLMNIRFEGSEDYNNSFVSIPESVSKSQTIIQFVLIPNLESNISEYLKCGNITPIAMVKGMGEESNREKEFKVEVYGTGKKTGAVTYKGNFKMDLSVGEGSTYYKKVELKKTDDFYATNSLPKAKINNASLEAQLLAEMKKQGFQEQFKKTYIQSNWQLFEPPFKVAYKEMTASFTYTTSDGKCGWQNYSFRSFKTGSGSWTSPQKWGGANQRQRMSCKKIK